MRRVKPIESREAALWKSAATEVVARSLKLTGGAIDAEHPILAGVDRYLEAFEAGDPIDPPAAGAHDDDPEVIAYLAQVYHRLAHAKVTGNLKLSQRLQKQLDDQLASFKHGNPLWQQMSEQYFAFYAAYPTHKGGKPMYRSWKDEKAGAGDLDFGVVEWRLPADARILLLGDIGTGTDEAAATLAAGLSFDPDVILHVGDVYFSGTHFEFANRFIGLFETVMKARKRRVPVFGVPGNHEYFTGNLAYFAWLDGGRLKGGSSRRQRASYFALRTEDDGWQFIGMDTGYYGHACSVTPDQRHAALVLLNAADPKVPIDLPPETLEPAPPMSRLRDDELEWLRHRVRTFDGRSVLLSHHPLYSAVAACGVAQAKTAAGALDPSDLSRLWVDTDLWRQLGPDFGERVPAWFWGHEHTLNIFQNGFRPPDWPTDAATNATFRPLPVGRCVGHAAIPVQAAEAPYAKTYPVPLKDDALQLGITDGWYNRGFAVLQLARAGWPAFARYYQLAGANPTPLMIFEESFGGSAPLPAAN